MSGLRYPGGKTRAVRILSRYLPSTCMRMVSIFLGGGSFEIHAASQGVIVECYDILNPLVSYWDCLLNRPQDLKTSVQLKHPITKDKFQNYQHQLKNNLCSDDLEKAALFFVLNRSSFSGTTMSGGFSKQAGEKRFTQSSIDRIRKNSWSKNMSVGLRDFELVLDGLIDDGLIDDDLIIFADPPYVLAKKLYGINGEGQNINHINLMIKITKFKKWIITYDDCPLVRELYKNHVIIPIRWAYGMNTSKKSNEVIIVSDDLLMELWIDSESSLELGDVC